MKPILLALLALCIAPFAAAESDAQRLLQLVDYVGLDYQEAIHDGTIHNRSEYREMVEFSASIAARAELLPPRDNRVEVIQLAQKLSQLVQDKQDYQQVREIASKIRLALINQYDISVVPRHKLDIAHAQQLYVPLCGSCHGEKGDGKGPQSAALLPRPINFQNRQRYLDRSLYGLYSTITNGVQGSAMVSFANSLSEVERWSLAFYVGQLGSTPEERQLGEQIWGEGKEVITPLTNPHKLATITPNEAIQKYGENSLALIAFLRSNPRVLFFSSGDSPLSLCRDKLQKSLYAYQNGQRSEAYQLSVEAYLQGFEAAEESLNAIDPKMMKRIETGLMQYRKLVLNEAPLPRVRLLQEHLSDELQEAEKRLATTIISSRSAFKSAFNIMLHEALEAFLVVLIILAVMLKIAQPHQFSQIYKVVLLSLGLSLLTWVFTADLIIASGSDNGIKEPLTALIIIVLLLYSALQLRSRERQLHHAEVNNYHFAKELLNQPLLWGILLLMMVVLYRNTLKLLLAYQTLWGQANLEGQSLILLGMISSLASFSLLIWLLLRSYHRFSRRTVMRSCATLMLLITTIFAGKGIAALQKSGLLHTDNLQLPSIEMIGFFPTQQGVVVQGLLLLFTLVMLISGLRPKPKRRKPVNSSD